MSYAAHATPDTTAASEALVQQIAEVLGTHAVWAFAGAETACQCDRAWRPNSEWRAIVARAVLPLVEAEVASKSAWLLGEIDDLRALADRERARVEAAEAQVAPLRDEIALWTDSHRAIAEARLREQTRADAAEAALRQVREDLTALADLFEGRRDYLRQRAASGNIRIRSMDAREANTWDVALSDVRTRLARVGAADTQLQGSAKLGQDLELAADTQPEGAGEACGCGHRWSRHSQLGCLVEVCDSGSGSVADAVFCRCDLSTPPTPTAGSNGDTAPEACPPGWMHSDCPRPADTAPESGEGR